MYFGPRDLAGITLFAALWGVLNVTITPIFFNVFHLPFACDLIGFAALILAVWWSRKIGTATFVGLLALVINLIGRPYALHFFGFLAASVVFDVITFLTGYDRLFEKRQIGSIVLLSTSVFSAVVAGLVIGLFFMSSQALMQKGGVFGWAGLHAVGGVIGGIIGVMTLNAISIRGFTPKNGLKKEIGVSE